MPFASVIQYLWYVSCSSHMLSHPELSFDLFVGNQHCQCAEGPLRSNAGPKATPKSPRIEAQKDLTFPAFALISHLLVFTALKPPWAPCCTIH